MDPIFWSILLLLSGLLLLLLEVFVPSGGMLGFLSAAAMFSAVSLAFYHRGLEAGLIFILVAVVAVPMVLVTAFKYWPNTRLGRRVLLGQPTEDDVLPDSPQRRLMKSLVGKVGVAKSLMLPSGAIEVDGITLDAVSDGSAIERGMAVKIIQVHGNRVVVSPTEELPESDEEDENEDDPLNRSIESLGLDENPLA